MENILPLYAIKVMISRASRPYKSLHGPHFAFLIVYGRFKHHLLHIQLTVKTSLNNSSVIPKKQYKINKMDNTYTLDIVIAVEEVKKQRKN